MSNEPPRIRDDRRDPDLTRLKERLYAVEERQNATDRLVNGMHYALFGIPEDRTNNGLVGTMSDMKHTLTYIWGTVVIGVTIDAIARILFHH